MYTASKFKLKFCIILRLLQSLEVRCHIFCYVGTKAMEELAASTVKVYCMGKTWYRHGERWTETGAVKSNTVNVKGREQ